MTTNWDDYAQVRAACDAAHIALLTSRSTFTTVRTRLREAVMEGAEDQVAYLEKRVTMLAPLVDRSARDVTALSTYVEELRVRAVTDNVDIALAALTVLVGMMERTLAQTPDPTAALAAAATFAERVRQDANTLPGEEYRLRIVANEIAVRVQAMQESLP